MPQRRRKAAAGRRDPGGGKFRGGSLRDHVAAARTRTGTQVDHLVGAANGVFVVLDHDQRIALGTQLVQGAEECGIVAGMQADGRLVEDIAHAL